MTTPTVDAIARALVDQDRELTALRSALAQQTERAERAEADLARGREQIAAGLQRLARHLLDADLEQSLAIIAVLESGRLPVISEGEDQ